jgi:hypothetical protein
MTQESIAERLAMAAERQENICQIVRYSVNGSIGLRIFDVLSEMYNAGYAKAMAILVAQPTPGWISVSESMPKADERVTVLTDKGEWWAARCKQFDNTSKYEKIFIPEGLHPINAVITHWQYVALPSPPEPTPTKKENA